MYLKKENSIHTKENAIYFSSIDTPRTKYETSKNLINTSSFTKKKIEACLAFMEENYLKTEVKWVLKRPVKKRPCFTIRNLFNFHHSESLEVAQILESLNARNRFDFNYIPNEMDCIFFIKKYKYVQLTDKVRP